MPLFMQTAQQNKNKTGINTWHSAQLLDWSLTLDYEQ